MPRNQRKKYRNGTEIILINHRVERRTSYNGIIIK